MLLKDAIKKLINLKRNEVEIYEDLNKCHNMVLAQDILAKKELPCFDNSALDGFAIFFDEQKEYYELKGSSFAGDNLDLSVKSGEAIKITTGAKIPKNANTILKIEECVVKDNKVYPPKNIKFRDGYRSKGEEIKLNEIIFQKGEIIKASHIMMLAAQGISKVKVYKKPSIGIYSSGNEIIEPWQIAKDHQIYNANASGLMALLSSFGFESNYLGIIKDQKQDCIKAIKNAENFDYLVISGGAGKSEADFMRQSILELGYDEIFEKVNLKPGGPSKAYCKNGKFVFILAGNPMSSYICALLLLIPCLLRKEFSTIKAQTDSEIKLSSGRSNVVFGNFINGIFYLYNNGKYGSHMISPLNKNNAIYVSDPQTSLINKGEEILILTNDY